MLAVKALYGTPMEGWPALMAVALVMGGLQMLMVGLVGEYVWRTLNESRQRPRYLVEESTEPPTCGPAGPVSTHGQRPPLALRRRRR